MSLKKRKQEWRITDKTCPYCGKNFAKSPEDEWAYTYSSKQYCSWKCLRAAQRENDGRINADGYGTESKEEILKQLRGETIDEDGNWISR